VGIGFGQPIVMKVKNMHLPHPHPKGGFSDLLVEGRMVLLLCVGALVVRASSLPSVEPVCDIHTSSCTALLVLTPL